MKKRCRKCRRMVEVALSETVRRRRCKLNDFGDVLFFVGMKAAIAQNEVVIREAERLRVLSRSEIRNELSALWNSPQILDFPRWFTRPIFRAAAERKILLEMNFDIGRAAAGLPQRV